VWSRAPSFVIAPVSSVNIHHVSPTTTPYLWYRGASTSSRSLSGRSIQSRVRSSVIDDRSPGSSNATVCEPVDRVRCHRSCARQTAS
jgi:hypothetical protein